MLCNADRGIDVLYAPQSSMGGVVGVFGLCGVAMQEVGVVDRHLLEYWSRLIKPKAIAWLNSHP